MDKTAEADRGGVMVALVPDEAASAALLEHSEGTEPLDEQHITLAYLGTLGEEVPDDERTRDAVENIVGGIATRYAPLNGEANGWGLFHNQDDVVVALWNIPGINGLRQTLVDELRQVGIPVKSNFSYTPHQTVGYYQAADNVASPGRLPQPVKSGFMHLVLSWGREPWQRFPLTGVRHEATKRSDMRFTSAAKNLTYTLLPKDDPQGLLDIVKGMARPPGHPLPVVATRTTPASSPSRTRATGRRRSPAGPRAVATTPLVDLAVEVGSPRKRGPPSPGPVTTSPPRSG